MYKLSGFASVQDDQNAMRYIVRILCVCTIFRVCESERCCVCVFFWWTVKIKINEMRERESKGKRHILFLCAMCRHKLMVDDPRIYDCSRRVCDEPCLIVCVGKMNTATQCALQCVSCGLRIAGGQFGR